jgi:hypothetical protein
MRLNMNIEQSAYKSNESLLKINEIQPAVFLNTHNKTCNSKSDNDNQVTFSAFNGVGEANEYSISPGNICIIGSNDKEIQILVNQIIAGFKSNNLEITETSRIPYLSKYLAGRVKTSRNRTSQIIALNTSNTSIEIIEAVSASCDTRIVFSLEKLNILCGLSLQHKDSKDSKDLNRIIDSLGGDYNTRKHIVSSLNKGDFMVSNPKTESIHSLSNSTDKTSNISDLIGRSARAEKNQITADDVNYLTNILTMALQGIALREQR